MAPKAPIPASSRTRRAPKNRASREAAGAPPPSRRAAACTLSAAREAELLREAEPLGENTVSSPGKLARRVVWSSRIQRASERDTAELARTRAEACWPSGLRIRSPYPHGRCSGVYILERRDAAGPSLLARKPLDDEDQRRAEL
ncbi:hypothetical protein BE21_54965 [Sorangium cellulosum]|uniref:Uncharacterized protein n=1 Tax=Sorangium cellulosum TaxID=56 RepID=A0A150TCN0_SORCE|nr:hypothetical protein BE21_54965 [Sorangium cellulosum]